MCIPDYNTFTFYLIFYSWCASTKNRQVACCCPACSLVWEQQRNAWKAKAGTLWHWLSPLPQSVLRFCRLWSGTSRRGDRDWGASWSRSSTQWHWAAEDHPAPPSPPSLHSSSIRLSPALLSLRQQTKLQTPTIRRTNCKRTMAVYCKRRQGGSSAEMGRPVYAYMCMCVFVCSPIQCVGLCLCERLGHQTFHTCIHGEEVDWQHLVIVDVGVCCLLDFDFRSFVVMKKWSGKKTMEARKETRHGVINRMDQSVMSRCRKAP